jgi:UrcA family protein
VSLAGIDLATAAGRQQARERVRHEALRLCRQLVDTRMAEGQQALLDCVSDALAPLAARLAAPARVAQSR